MPKFRFTATDSSGLFRSGTLDADDPREARTTLRDRGFTVRELTEVSPGAGEPLPLDDEPAPAARRESGYGRSGTAAAGRPGSSRATFLLALFGFLIALATAGWVVYRDPPWGRLYKYDFGSPEAALKSGRRMEANGDLHAMIDYRTKLGRKKAKERLDSLTVEKVVDYPGKKEKDKGKKVVFFKYKEDGKDKKGIEWFEKDEESGLWKETYVSLNEGPGRFGMPPGDQPKEKSAEEQLAEEIRKWRADDRDE